MTYIRKYCYFPSVIPAGVQMLFWLLATFLVYIFLPARWALSQDELMPVFNFMSSIFPGINASVGKSTYPETMRVMLTVMWLTTPLQIPGYIYAEYLRVKKINLIQPAWKMIMFVIILGAPFFLFSLLGVYPELHNNEGEFGGLLNLLYTNILGVIIYVGITVTIYSWMLSMAIAYLVLYLNQGKKHKEK